MTVRRRSPLAPLLALLCLAPLAPLPSAAADHLEGMTVSQRGIGPFGMVRLEVTFRVTGQCCGGIFEWTTGDGASASIPDGVVDGAYVGDEEGYAGLSDGRTARWERVRDAAGIVHISIWYHYERAGIHRVEWHDCCPDHQGRLDVLSI